MNNTYIQARVGGINRNTTAPLMDAMNSVQGRLANEQAAKKREQQLALENQHRLDVEAENKRRYDTGVLLAAKNRKEDQLHRGEREVLADAYRDADLNRVLDNDAESKRRYDTGVTRAQKKIDDANAKARVMQEIMNSSAGARGSEVYGNYLAQSIDAARADGLLPKLSDTSAEANKKEEEYWKSREAGVLKVGRLAENQSGKILNKGDYGATLNARAIEYNAANPDKTPITASDLATMLSTGLATHQSGGSGIGTKGKTAAIAEVNKHAQSLQHQIDKQRIPLGKTKGGSGDWRKNNSKAVIGIHDILTKGTDVFALGGDSVDARVSRDESTINDIYNDVLNAGYKPNAALLQEAVKRSMQTKTVGSNGLDTETLKTKLTEMLTLGDSSLHAGGSNSKGLSSKEYGKMSEAIEADRVAGVARLNGSGVPTNAFDYWKGNGGLDAVDVLFSKDYRPSQKVRDWTAPEKVGKTGGAKVAKEVKEAVSKPLDMEKEYTGRSVSTGHGNQQRFLESDTKVVDRNAYKLNDLLSKFKSTPSTIENIPFSSATLGDKGKDMVQYLQDDLGLTGSQLRALLENGKIDQKYRKTISEILNNR